MIVRGGDCQEFSCAGGKLGGVWSCLMGLLVEEKGFFCYFSPSVSGKRGGAVGFLGLFNKLCQTR